MANALFDNLDRVHTTPLGAERIRKNLDLAVDDVVLWCRQQMSDPESITRTGKNWYVRGKGFVITVNAHSYTIITARKEAAKKGSDMSDVGIIRRLDDIPAMKQQLIQVFDTKTHRRVSLYGLLLADHIRQLTDMPPYGAVDACYDVNRRWQDGAATFQEARDVAGLLHDLAGTEKDPAMQKALRAMGQIAAIPHVKRHALIASDYAVKVINLLYTGDMKAVEKERALQIALMESV